MLVDYDSKERKFFVLTKSYETVTIPYPLLDKDHKGQLFNEDSSDYDYKILYKKNYKENDIYQVIDGGLEKRIGWIFPISSIISTSHDFANNPHYCRYAFLAHIFLLQNEISDQDIIDKDFNDIVDELYSDDTIIFIYKKSLTKEIENFKIESYFASLCEYGYYIIHDYENPNIKEPKSKNRIQLYRMSEDIVSNEYMPRFFGMLCQEKHPIIKFHILYQVIELLIEDILISSLEDTIKQFRDKKIYTRSLRERISKIEAEKDRISMLVEKCGIICDDYNELHEKCISFLTKRGRENIDFPMSIYSLRNFIVHDYRFIIDETELNEISTINGFFEMLILDLIIKYKH